MTTQTEALKIARTALGVQLDALLGKAGHLHNDDRRRYAENGIKAIDEALAQPEQEPVAYCDIHHLPEPCVQCAKEHEGYNIPPQPKETEQEPVACTDVMCACQGGSCVSCPDGEHEKAQLEQKPALGMKHSVMYSNYKD